MIGVDGGGLRPDDDFFALGGTSLSATRLIARVADDLGVALTVRDVFETPTVGGLAARIATTSATAGPRPVPGVVRPAHMPLSHAQHRIWFLNQMDPESTSFTVPIAVRLRGPLDTDALRSAVRDVVDRHEILRTVFPSRAGEPCQAILEPGEADVDVDVVPTAHDDPAADVRAAVAPIATFDVTRDLPLRVRVIARADDDWLIALVAHHIAVDGQSARPLVGDLVAAYSARAAGRASLFVPLPMQFADHALWQRAALGSADDTSSTLGRDLRWWLRRLADLPPVLSLPLDRPRPAVASGAGAVVRTRVPADIAAGVESLARDRGATAFMVVHAAVAALLSRLAGTGDIAVATPVSGRGGAVVDDLVGMFVGTLVLRTRVDPDAAFDDLLGLVRDDDIDAFDRAAVPFEHLVERLSPVRSEAFAPLAQVMVAMNHAEPIDLGPVAGGRTIEPVEVGLPTARHDLAITVTVDDDSGWDVEVLYATDILDQDTVRRWADLLVATLDAVTAAPTVVVGDLGAVEAAPLTDDQATALLAEMEDAPDGAPVQILDARGLPVPVGMIGEVVVGGRATGLRAHVTTVGDVRVAREVPVITPPAPVDEHALDDTDRVVATVASIVGDVLGETAPGPDTDFFALGGTSLSAVRVAGRVGEAFGVDIGVRDFLAAPTVLGLADTVRAARRAAHPLRPRDPGAVVPVGLAQRRIWFLNQLDPSSTTYLMPVALDIDGPLDRATMHAAVGDVIARHTALRTVFPTDDDGVPRQQVLDVDVALARPWWHDAASTDEAMALCATGFDVTRDMPIRAALAGAGERHRLVVVLHHIAGDAASGDILARDLAEAYRRRSAGDRLPVLDVGHADHTLWERAVLGDVDDPVSVLGEQAAWWRERLTDLPARSDIPTDRPRPRAADGAGGRVPLVLGRERSSALVALGRRRGLTTFMTVHAALSVTVAAFTGSDDVVIGAPVSGRRHPATADMVGMFVNTVVLRTTVRPDDTVEDLFGRVRDDDTAAFSHADLPFDLLVEMLAPDRADRRPPIHQITLNLLEENETGADALGDLGLVVRGVELGPEPAKVDLAVGVAETTDGLRGSITYAAALYDAATVERFRDAFLRVVDALVAGVAPGEAVLGDTTAPVGSDAPVVLDRRLRMVPEGVVGDLWLRGSAVPGLMPGAVAATRVVADPVGPPGARMYRTGDVARMRGAGVEVIGAQAPSSRSVAVQQPADDRAAEPSVGVIRETERWIATVFAEVAAVPTIAPTDNFFDSGGTSLSAARAVAKLRRQGISVELPWVFSDPTPRALAARVAAGADGGRVLLTLRADGSGPPLFCVHPAGGLGWMYGGLAPFLPDRPIHALQDPAVVAGEPAPTSIEAYARRYVDEIRQIQRNGPYHLLGWSLGGHIAHAMTEQLEAAGEQVAVLGLLDTWVGDLDVRAAAPSDPLDGWRALFDLGDDVQATTPDEVAAVVRDHIAHSGLLPADRVTAIMDSFAAADAVAADHVPGRVRAPAVVVVATADKSDPDAVASSWDPYCGSVTRVDVDAGHLQMGGADVLAVVALHLRAPRS